MEVRDADVGGEAVSGNLVAIVSEAGGTVLLICGGLLAVRWLARRLDEAEARTRDLAERVLRQGGLPPGDPQPPGESGP